MQPKLFLALAMSTLTVASPIAQGPEVSAIAIPDIPVSILSVMETAVPASWYEEMLNSASRDSIISEIQAGTLPAWYNSLPASVKAWATSAGNAMLEGMLGATATATATPTAGGNRDTNRIEPTHAVTATPVATAATTATTSLSKAPTTKTSPDSSASETAASPSKSTTPSSSTSTGGAPLATAGVAMSFAGAAGLLGLALAL